MRRSALSGSARRMKNTTALHPLPALGLSWPLIVGLLTTLGLFVIGRSQLVIDTDTYLHISAGRWMLLHHTVPTVDIFSYTKLGTPWTAHEWLAEIILAVCYEWAGWAGLALLTYSAMGATLSYQLRYLLGRLEPIHALFFCALTGLAMTGHLWARPHVLAWPLLAIWLCQLLQAVEDQHPPKWWLLPIMVLWANLHGGFTLGLALMLPLFLEAVFAAPRQSRWAVAKPWLVFMGTAFLAAMVTPSGWHGIWFTVQIMQLESLSSVLEWMPPVWIYLWLLEGWIFLMLALGLSGRLQVPIFRLLLLLGLLHLALAHRRNVPIFAMLAPFLLATPLTHYWYTATSQNRQAEGLDQFFHSLVPKAKWPATVLAALTVVVTTTLTGRNGLHQPHDLVTPAKALQAAQSAGIKGHVFHTYHYGGFLIFNSIPVFIDGRVDMYGDAMMEKYSHALDTNQPEKLPQLLDEYRVNWTLLTASAPAVRRLDDLQGWQRVYEDENAVVHKRELALPEDLSQQAFAQMP